MEVWIRGEWERRRGNGIRKGGWRGVWDEEGREEFKERMEKVEIGRRDLEIGRKEVEKRIERH